MIPVFKYVGERSTAKNYCLVSLFLWLVTSLKNLYIISLCITRRNAAYAGKTQLVLFDPSINTGDIDVKMDGSVSLLN